MNETAKWQLYSEWPWVGYGRIHNYVTAAGWQVTLCDPSLLLLRLETLTILVDGYDGNPMESAGFLHYEAIAVGFHWHWNEYCATSTGNGKIL